MKFFKKPSKKQASDEEHEDHDDVHNLQYPGDTSPVKSSSPTKSHSKSPTKTSAPKLPRPESPSHRDSKTRTPRPFARHPTDPGSSSSSRRKKIDPDTHPLNLPPEQRKRLSAMSNRNSMDIDKEPANGVNGTSSTPTSPQAQPAPTLPKQHSFTVPKQNGTPSSPSPMNVDENVPVPPPHKSNPATPAPTPAEEAEAFKTAGNKFFKDKEYQRAIAEYTKAVNLQPDSPTYLSNRAAAYMSAGRFEDALDDCKKAADLDPQNSKILLRLARIYTSMGQPDEALTTFGRIQPPPSARDMAPAREMLQHVKAAQNALQDGTSGSMVTHALDMAERGLGIGALKPRKWQLMRGEAHLRMGSINSLGEAQNIAMSLLRMNSQDPEALVLRGRALYSQGENDKAVQHFRKALSCDPDFKDAIKWLRIVQKLERMKEEGNKEYKSGRWAEAIQLYTDALAIDPTNRGTNSKILQNRALCKMKLKQYDEAIADCEKAFSLDPSYLKARKTKANALGQAERWEDAVKEWKAIAELDPEDRTVPKEVRRAELELKKSQRKDYYKILGISKDADDKEIKKAYRKLAVIHHPDKNPGDEQAEARFKDIGEAYETLSDPQKRARFDNGDDLMDPSDMFGGGGGMGGGMGGIDPEILFSMMGGQGGGNPFGGGGGGFPGGAQFHFGGGGGGQRQRGFPQGFNFS